MRLRKKNDKPVQTLPTERDLLIEKINSKTRFVRRGQYFHDYLKTASKEKLEAALRKIEDEIAAKRSEPWRPIRDLGISVKSGSDYIRVREEIDFNNKQQWQ